ncbi:hypothetical protein HPB49_010598 [Dermacentor silvarum]|uniref:Uncharacterized protein n=1 Tax=Dermacentor silvarum TaxID=543639 RepID=A0ACB8CWL1_DERSI|nr:hypothetical protein HPB49_010598 [Dermacentor silvarum]
MESTVEGELISEEEWLDDSWKSPGYIAQERRRRELKAQGKECVSQRQLQQPVPVPPSMVVVVPAARLQWPTSTSSQQVPHPPLKISVNPTSPLGKPAPVRQRHNNKLRRRIAKLEREIEAHTSTLERQQWGQICNSLNGQLGCKKTWHLLRHLLDPGNTKSAARNQLTKIIHQYPGTDAELLADLASRSQRTAGR